MDAMPVYFTEMQLRELRRSQAVYIEWCKAQSLERPGMAEIMDAKVTNARLIMEFADNLLYPEVS